MKDKITKAISEFLQDYKLHLIFLLIFIVLMIAKSIMGSVFDKKIGNIDNQIQAISTKIDTVTAQSQLDVSVESEVTSLDTERVKSDSETAKKFMQDKFGSWKYDVSGDAYKNGDNGEKEDIPIWLINVILNSSNEKDFNKSIECKDVVSHLMKVELDKYTYISEVTLAIDGKTKVVEITYTVDNSGNVEFIGSGGTISEQ